MDYELAIRGLLSMQAAIKSGESGYPHTHVHEASSGAAADSASDPDLVRGLEAAAGGSPAAAASQAVEAGVEPPMQAAGAAAATGDVGGAVAAAAGAAAGRKDTAGSSSSSKQGPSQAKVKRVLMGHSLGGACAAIEYINNPKDYAAVVLVDPAIIAGLGGPGEKDRPDSPVKLEKLQDGTAFTRSLASGTTWDADSAGADVSSSSSSTMADLDELAAEQGNLTRSSSRFSSSGSESDINGSSGVGSVGRGDGIGAAVAAGDVMLYATRGDDATFAKLIREQQSAGQANAAVKLLTNSIGLIRSFVMLTSVFALSLLRPIIVVLLRIAVRSRKFWANTLEQVRGVLRLVWWLMVHVVPGPALYVPVWGSTAVHDGMSMVDSPSSTHCIHSYLHALLRNRINTCARRLLTSVLLLCVSSRLTMTSPRLLQRLLMPTGCHSWSRGGRQV